MYLIAQVAIIFILAGIFLELRDIWKVQSSISKSLKIQAKATRELADLEIYKHAMEAKEALVAIVAELSPKFSSIKRGEHQELEDELKSIWGKMNSSQKEVFSICVLYHNKHSGVGGRKVENTLFGFSGYVHSYLSDFQAK